jgi:hypothetical protein
LPQYHSVLLDRKKAICCSVKRWGLSRVLERGGEHGFFVGKSHFERIGENISPQLALSSVFGEFDGILSGFSGVLSSLDELFGVFAGEAHFPELAVNNPVADSREENQKAAEPSDARRPLRHPTFISLMAGFFFLFLGLCSGMAVVKGSEYAEGHDFPWWIPFIAFIGGTYFFAYQGLTFLEVLR